MSSQINTPNFFTLPREIRDCIYELVLVYEHRDMRFEKPRDEPQVDPSILRTSKQIHHETSLILYSKNTFRIGDPASTLRWLNRIGPNNLKFLRSIHLWVDFVDDTNVDIPKVPFWGKLFDRLAQEATGLQHVQVYWEFDEKYGIFSPGKDVNFVRQLTKLKGIQSLVLSGTYALRWPQFLAEKMGVEVQEPGKDVQKGPSWFQLCTKHVVP